MFQSILAILIIVLVIAHDWDKMQNNNEKSMKVRLTVDDKDFNEIFNKDSNEMSDKDLCDLIKHLLPMTKRDQLLRVLDDLISFNDSSTCKSTHCNQYGDDNYTYKSNLD